MHISQNIKRIVLGACSALMIVSISASYVFAQELTSSSFSLNNNGFTAWGGYSTTSNFSSFGSEAQPGSGESSSASFSLASGYLYPVDTSPLATQNWKWFDDSTNFTPTIALAGENVSPSNVGFDDPLKLRITVKDIGGSGVTGLKLRLQYATSSDFSAGAIFVAEQGQCNLTIWCYADGAGVDNTVISDTVLSDPDACSGGLGTGCGTYNESGTTTSTFYHSPGKKTEYEFTLKQILGVQSTVYFFRLVDASTGIPVPLNTGATYPSLMINGASLTFSIGGLTSGTSTEGVTTDIATSPTTISFGTLLLNTPRIAAHRLTVTTNATSGYKIYTYQRQGLLNQSARELPPVNTTNSAPSGWASACTSTSTGCYGYHSGQDVLEGGSTRFAADDSYAQFTSSPDEVAFSAGPATNAMTDMVYKIEAKDLQDSGVYESTIVYIATPVF